MQASRSTGISRAIAGRATGQPEGDGKETAMTYRKCTRVSR